MKKIDVEVKITISDGKSLGQGIKCFNLPNNNCGVVEIENTKSLCDEGAGRKASECEKCEYQKSCKKIVFCSGATMICNNRCYQNNSLTIDTKKIVFGNYLSSLQDDFVSNMEEEIRKSVVKANIKYFRIHSLGEFYSYKYFCDWMRIAQKFSGQVNFVTYTKCFGMVDKYVKENGDIPSNVKIMLSIMPDSLYGTKQEVESCKLDEEGLRKKKEQMIGLIKSLLSISNVDIYLTAYDKVFTRILKEGQVDWLQGMQVQECMLHYTGKKCAECIINNSNKGGCYIFENIENRNRIIIEKIRVTNGEADYRHDIKNIQAHNETLAKVIESEIE